MKRAEAIEQLQYCIDLIKQDGQDYLDERDIPLLDMAIEALSKPNYESDTEVRLAVTDRNKDKVILWDAFGEVEYYPNGEINCVHCPHYHETEDDTGVHSHCGGGDAEMNEVKSPYMQQSPNRATHGRLIDAEFEEQHYTSMLLNPTPDVTAKDRENAKIILGALKMAKTVSADRPHGEWIEREDWNGDSYYDCSVCGESFVLCDGTPSMNLYHFCPNCGADMRKEKE